MAATQLTPSTRAGKKEDCNGKSPNLVVLCLVLRKCINMRVLDVDVEKLRQAE